MRKPIVRSLNWKKAIGPSKCVKGGGLKSGGLKAATVKVNGFKKPAATVKPQGERILKGKAKQAYSDEDYEEEDEYVGVEGVGNCCNNSDGEGGSVSTSCFMENMMMEYMKMKSRKRKGKGEESFYQKRKIPKLEGHKVLSKGEVLKTHRENVGKYPNIVSRVESFSHAVSAFDPKRKQLVSRMGFNGLLELDMKNIPRQFCYWLMARVLEDEKWCLVRVKICRCVQSK